MPVLDPFSAAIVAVEERLRLGFATDRWDFSVVPDPLSSDEFKSLVRRTPLLALGWRQLNPEQNNGRRFLGPLGLRLTIVVKNPQIRARFLGDARGPGLFPSIAGALALLNGFTVPDLGTFFVTACAQAYAEGYTDMDCAIATIDLTMAVALGDVLGQLAASDEFLSMLSAFAPWPDGQDPDEPFDVRPAP
jgi:hypothetical protein